jgi:hypothetical protein
MGVLLFAGIAENGIGIGKRDIWGNLWATIQPAVDGLVQQGALTLTQLLCKNHIA